MKETERVSVKIKKLSPKARLPDYASSHAAGADLYAALDEDCILPPGGRCRIPTGLSMELPPFYEAQVRPRSGLAFRYGITLLNTPGTIDADFRGELQILMVNLGTEEYTIHDGDRIAQLIVAPISRASFLPADQLSQTDRDTGGFGSTGL